MAKKYYLPYGFVERYQWFSNFSSKLKTYEKVFGLTAAQLAIVAADWLMIAYVLQLVEGAKSFYDTMIAFRNTLFNGAIGATPVAIPLFTTPANPPAAVPNGIFGRTRLFVKMLKAHPACTVAIQEDLGILGDDIFEDFDDAKPVLKVKNSGNKVGIKYAKKGAEAAWIESKRGDEADFSFLTVATKASYTDSRPNLVAGKAENRQYRAWFLVADEKVGHLSDVVTVAVVG